MFKFKQFTIFQYNTSMKVCTDSCLFGSIITDNEAKTALDIGAGTGLLSLMVAQRHTDLKIDAVEIDAGAVKDTAVNIENSPFSENITLYHQPIQQHPPDNKYNLIFSNPPFYENKLKSPNENKNVAHHATLLNFKDLALTVSKHLKENGRVWMMLPPDEMLVLEKLFAEKELYPKSIFEIRHNDFKPVFRKIVEFAGGFVSNPVVTEISIYEKDYYSAIFTNYLKDYYLIF